MMAYLSLRRVSPIAGACVVATAAAAVAAQARAVSSCPRRRCASSNPPGYSDAVKASGAKAD